MPPTTKLQSFLSTDKPTTETTRSMEQDECSFYSTHSQEQPSYQQHPSTYHQNHVIDTLEEDPEQSVTAAEPIEDDEDHILHDSTIPTIRLSSLGTALLDDAQQVQNEFGKGGGVSLSSNDDDDDDDGQEDSYDSHSQEEDDGDDDEDVEEGFGNPKKERLDTDRTSTTGSEEMTMTMMDDTNGNSPLSQSLPEQSQAETFVSRRQRTVSEDGIIAEFDPDEGPYNSTSNNSPTNDPNNPATDNDNQNNHNDHNHNHDMDHIHNGVKIVAEAIEIDASFRSDVHDLELGDEEPFPYPGASRFGSGARARALEESNSRRSALRFLTSHAGQYGRPELISATVIKSSVTEPVGLNLMRDETLVYSISDEDGSLLKDSPFRPGDRVLSINGRRTESMDSAEAAVLLREATGFVHIVVHNAGGDPTLVETMITKANKNQRSGMGLKSTGDRDLRVSSINENGLFAQSLLNVGDRILSINDVDVTEVDARVACDIIKNSPDHVTVVARTRHTAGVVVAEVSARGLHACSEPVLTSIAENTSSRNRNEIEAVDDTCAMNKRQREQLVIGACVALVLFIIMMSVFGRGIEFVR